MLWSGLLTVVAPNFDLGRCPSRFHRFIEEPYGEISRYWIGSAGCAWHPTFTRFVTVFRESGPWFGRARLGVIALQALAILFTTSACVPSWDTIEEVVPDEPRHVAAQFFDALRGGDIDAVVPLLHPDVEVGAAREAIAPLLPVFAESAPAGTRFGSWNWVYRDSRKQHHLSYEIRARDRFLVVFLAIQYHAERPLVAAVQWRDFESSPIDANRFSLEGKTPGHYALLLVAIAIPSFCLVCFVLCWRRRPRRRWLWLLATLFAGPVLTLNWTTGELSLKALSFNLLGAGFAQGGPLEPMFLSIGLPIGALVFLIVRPEPAQPSADSSGPQDRRSA